MKLLITIILGTALAISGEMLAFHVYSSYSQGGFINGLMGITAFIAIFFGLILALSYPVVYAEKLTLLITKKSKFVKFVAVSIIFAFLATPFVIAVVTYYHFTGKYHDTQLEQFGLVKNVVIESEIFSKGSRHDLCFSFWHDGKLWEGTLDAWQYQVGDSAEIIYSSQNPNETEWNRKYIEELPSK